jgi:hypothetical protein|tara:strand:- start:5811 stop:6032 length:222 start_codon:yes stop_codon:yes gene_type:complete
MVIQLERKMNTQDLKIQIIQDRLTRLDEKMDTIIDLIKNFKFEGEVEYGQPNHISNNHSKYLNMKPRIKIKND